MSLFGKGISVEPDDRRTAGILRSLEGIGDASLVVEMAPPHPVFGRVQAIIEEKIIADVEEQARIVLPRIAPVLEAAKDLGAPRMKVVVAALKEAIRHAGLDWFHGRDMALRCVEAMAIGAAWDSFPPEDACLGINFDEMMAGRVFSSSAPSGS